MISQSRARFWLLSALLALSIGVLACSSSDNETSTAVATSVPEATATVAPEPTQPPAPPASPQAVIQEADGNRIYEDARYLSRTPRSAGTAGEREAAEWIADKLRNVGYEVSFQEFTVETQARASSFSVSGAANRRIVPLPLQSSGSGDVRRPLVAAGIGRTSEFPASAAGNVVLIERGELTFNDKVRNAEAAGAVGVVIYNNEPGSFFGTLSNNAGIPVISITQEDGRALAADLGRGAIEAQLMVDDNGQAISRNVIARPPGRDCETITGGHYDSVPQAPGASDNATGTAAVIEIASIIAGKGEMAGNCFVLFGAEENGLIGSKFYVQSLDDAARARIKAMLNFDMVGVGQDGWLFIGDSALQRRAQSIGAALGVNGALGNLRSSSSDHASFQQAGIPAFMLHRTTDNLLHTPQDVIDRVQPELLEQAAKLGVSMLESLNSNG